MDKIFKSMDRNKDAKLTFEEFREGSKQDPTIIQVSTASQSSYLHLFIDRQITLSGIVDI